jgi:hypothetical protein
LQPGSTLAGISANNVRVVEKIAGLERELAVRELAELPHELVARKRQSRALLARSVYRFAVTFRGAKPIESLLARCLPRLSVDASRVPPPAPVAIVADEVVHVRCDGAPHGATEQRAGEREHTCELTIERGANVGASRDP